MWKFDLLFESFKFCFTNSSGRAIVKRINGNYWCTYIIARQLAEPTIISYFLNDPLKLYYMWEWWHNLGYLLYIMFINIHSKYDMKEVPFANHIWTEAQIAYIYLSAFWWKPFDFAVDAIFKANSKTLILAWNLIKYNDLYLQRSLKN